MDHPIFHASDVDPTDYVWLLVGAGLRDAEITVAFSRMINGR